MTDPEMRPERSPTRLAAEARNRAEKGFLRADRPVGFGLEGRG